MSIGWTDERIAQLTKMWEGGATASQIAEELGGVSRNAVIGKAHRLGLKARPSPVAPVAQTKPAAPVQTPVEVTKPTPRAPAPPAPHPIATAPSPAPAATGAAPGRTAFEMTHRHGERSEAIQLCVMDRRRVGAAGSNKQASAHGEAGSLRSR